MPPAHCRVSFMTSLARTSSREEGQCRWKRPTSTASTARASMSARFCPMQSRGPAGQAGRCRGGPGRAAEEAGQKGTVRSGTDVKSAHAVPLKQQLQV